MSIGEKIKEIARTVNGSIEEGYSGRGMFGAECVGIDCVDAMEVVEQSAVLGLPRPHWDNLGKGFICYWPSIKSLTAGKGQA